MKPATIRKLHRWTGLTCALGLLMASTSGILHVVMTWTQSAPPLAALAGSIDPAQIRIAPAEAFARLGAGTGTIASISLRVIGGEPWWQFLTGSPATPRYVSAVDGRVEPTVLEKVKPGDAISARMSRRTDDWWLTEVEVLPPQKN